MAGLDSAPVFTAFPAVETSIHKTKEKNMKLDKSVYK